MSRIDRALPRVLSVLGLAFVLAGGLKLRRPELATGMFAQWGLDPGWAVPVAGWGEVVLGLMLFHLPWQRLGASGLGAWMIGFGALQIAAGQIAAAGASLVVLLVCGGALARRPWSAGDPLLRLPAPLLDPPRSTHERIARSFRLVGLSFFIRWAVGGILFWTALPLLARAHADREDERVSRAEATLLYLLVLGVGTSGLWAFVGHTFLSDVVSASVGWPASPFQEELAFYHLGVGIAGLACWWTRDHFWSAVALITGIFLYGAGWVHLSSFLETGNCAPANWGLSVLFGNALLPTALVVLLALRQRRPAGRAASIP